jgi:DNA processing protein
MHSAQGNNALIKDGAIAITTFEDLQEYIPFLKSSVSTNSVSDLEPIEKEILLYF